MSKGEELIEALIHTARLCRTLRSELLLKHGLYVGQDTLLRCLDEEDGRSMGTLAGLLRVRPPTVTKMVTRMSAQGFIGRKTNPIDSRQSNVFITEKGAKVMKKIDKAWRKTEKTSLFNVGKKRKKELAKSFQQISENIQDHQSGNANLEV
ncbi:MAG: winged helix-turn-helix transcriptional regulator [Rhizobiaceae bacterium]|nr:winged helix-turn-helix transcriptional regulator [Rhizobiaceae bacterium]